MKKSLLTLTLLCLIGIAFAQETKKDTIQISKGDNEIRLNLLNTIIGIPEITYERLFKDNSGAGLSVLVGIDDNTDYKFGVIPYYRIYFGNSLKKGTGFFIEANSSVMQVKNDFYYDYIWPDGNNGVITNNDWNFGLGAAAGGKFLTKNGFVGEIYLGVGRFFNKNSYVEAYPRVGITIGKRF